MKRLIKLLLIFCTAVLLRETSKQKNVVSSFQLYKNPSHIRTQKYYVDSSLRVHSNLYAGKQTWSNSGRSRRRKAQSNRHELNTRSRELLQSFERIGKQQYTSKEKQAKLFRLEIETLLENTDLTQLIIPRDASSLIRLLGRNRIYDVMLQFCRRYCRDIFDASLISGERARYTKEEAKEAILYCYTAAISACSKPVPYLDLSTAQSEIYRKKTFLLSLVDEMENGYFDNEGFRIRPNSYTLSAVLLGIDDESEALEVLEQFEQRYGENETDSDTIVTVQVYNAAISACSRSYFVKNEEKTYRADGWQLGLSLYNKMKRNGPAPNEQTLIAVLQALAEYGQLRVAMSIFDEMKQTSSVELKSKLYKPLLKACATAKKATVAEKLIEQMKDGGVKVTTEHMNIFLLTLSKCKLHTRALEVLQEMIELQEIEQSAAPDIVTFNTVLSACANADEYEAARILLDDMRDGIYLIADDISNELIEVRPDVISYNTVISCADPIGAFELINEMRLTRRNRIGVIYPNSISYTNAIARCRKASTSSDLDVRRYAFDIAFSLFELAKESILDTAAPRVDLNVYLYSSLIWVAESVGNYKAAVQILRSMECSPNTVCYDGVISALSKRGLHREALYFYFEMQKLGFLCTRNVYSKLAFAINNARDPEVFASPRKKAALLEGVLSRMSERDRSVSVGGPLFEMLIRCHGNKAEQGSSHTAARLVFDQIEGPVDNACLSAMLRVYSSVSMWEEAIMVLHCSDIVKEATGPGRISTRALSYAVIACARANQFNEAFNIIELYGSKFGDHNATSEVVTIKALNALIGACGRAQRPDLSVEILNDMQKKYGVTPDVKSYRTAIIACNQAEHRESKDTIQTNEVHFDFTWWECALSLLRRMIEDGLKPDSQTYSSVVSALESAGQWQRALGVLQTMPSMAPLMGNSLALDVMSSVVDEVEVFEPPNLYVLNAAISACEKGGAWVEALNIYENIRAQEHAENATKPNFITVNSLLIALDKAGQTELAMSIYDEAVRDKILNPMKRQKDNDGTIQRMMDLHKFSAPMAKIAINSYLNSFLRSRKELSITSDAIIIVGKGKGSEGEPVLMPTVMKLLAEEYDLAPEIDPKNSGRIRIPKKSIEDLIMVSFRSGLLSCLLATTSYAFAVKPISTSPAFTHRSNGVARAPVNLSMSGGSQAVPDLKAPPAIYDGAVAAGAAKASASWAKIFKLGIAAGCHIGFGSYLAITVGGACPQIAEANPGLQKIIFGAFGLPFGLIMTLVTGGELFTGNTALVTAAAMEGKTTKADLIKNWVASYAGNFVGSLILAFLAFKSGTLGAAPASVAIATAKCSLPFDVAFVRGILCNWLVCMAVYMASGCASLAGKMVAVWFPISAFVALGLDHSVANMFIIPLGMMRGAKITMADFITKNLIPVTLGNIVGGALCVMGIYGTAYGKWFAAKDE